jgi:hypothetical protein
MRIVHINGLLEKEERETEKNKIRSAYEEERNRKIKLEMCTAREWASCTNTDF